MWKCFFFFIYSKSFSYGILANGFDIINCDSFSEAFFICSFVGAANFAAWIIIIQIGLRDSVMKNSTFDCETWKDGAMSWTTEGPSSLSFENFS